MDIFVIIAIVVIIFVSLSSVPTPMATWEIEEMIEREKDSKK